MMFKVDLHVHSVLGGDSHIRPCDLVDQSRAAGLDAVCITEHLSYDISAPFDEISRKSGFPILRGMEYKAAEGHLLIFGVRVNRGNLPPGLPIQNVINWVHTKDGVAIPAHPYQKNIVGESLGDGALNLQGLYALEVANGSVSSANNRLALQAAMMMHIRGTGGSDAHGLSRVGTAYTVFSSAVKTEQELVEALRFGNYKAYPNDQDERERN
jgi:predicted metal-dependent phosphoesterase TrpH